MIFYPNVKFCEKWPLNKGFNIRFIAKTASVVYKLQKFDCSFSAKVLSRKIFVVSMYLKFIYSETGPSEGLKIWVCQ